MLFEHRAPGPHRAVVHRRSRRHLVPIRTIRRSRNAPEFAPYQRWVHRLRRRWEQAVLDRAHPIELACTESLCHRTVDIFDMNEADTVALLLGNRRRIGVADEQMTGVEAEQRGTVGEEPFELLGRFDQRVDVRMNDLGEAVLGGNLLGLGQPFEQCRPFADVNVGRSHDSMLEMTAATK